MADNQNIPSNGNSPKTLFCLPHAGGSASVFTQLEASLAKHDIKSYTIEYPGHGSRMREPLCRNIEDLVSDVVEQLVKKEGDFCLYGHSLGGHVAFEVARALRKRKKESLKHLFLSGNAGPSVPIKLRGLHDLEAEEFYSRLSELGGVQNPEKWDEEVRKIFLPILRADFEIVSSIDFTKEEPLSIPITAYAGTEDIYSCNEIQQWQSETIFPLSIYQFTGDHFFPFTNFQKIATLFKKHMTQSEIQTKGEVSQGKMI